MLIPKLRPDAEIIVSRFIGHFMRSAGKDKVVIGISGGLDSAVVAKLCSDVLGNRNIICLALPYGKGSIAEADALRLGKELDLDIEVKDIAPMMGLLETSLNVSDLSDLGNLKARTRMLVLYTIASKNNALVVGTGNKSELLTGYFTKFGDGASDFLPIGDIYKTQVFELAGRIGIPDHFIEKAPSADLQKGQTDEADLGMTYAQLDRILHGFELNLSTDSIAGKLSLDLKMVEEVQQRMIRNIHKRETPQIPKLGVRTIGIDWRDGWN